GAWGRAPDGACQEKQNDHTGRGESDLPAPEGDTENDDVVQVRRHRGKGARGRRRGRRNRHTTDCSTWSGLARRGPTAVVTCTDVFSTHGDRHFGKGRGQGIHLDRCGLFGLVATQPIGPGRQDGSANFTCVDDASSPRRVLFFEGVLRRPCGRRYEWNRHWR